MQAVLRRESWAAQWGRGFPTAPLLPGGRQRLVLPYAGCASCCAPWVSTTWAPPERCLMCHLLWWEGLWGICAWRLARSCPAPPLHLSLGRHFLLHSAPLLPWPAGPPCSALSHSSPCTLSLLSTHSPTALPMCSPRSMLLRSCSTLAREPGEVQWHP